MLAAINLVLIGSVGLLGFVQSRRAITRDASRHLLGVAKNRVTQLEIWYQDKIRDITLISELPQVKELCARISDPSSGTVSDSLELAGILNAVQNVYKTYGPCGIFDTDGKSLVRNSLCAAQREDVVDLPEFQRALKSREAFLGEIHLFKPDTTVMRLAKSVMDESGNPSTVIIFTILPAKTLTTLLADTTGLGETGETFLVSSDHRLVTPFRHPVDSLNESIRVDTEGPINCLGAGTFMGKYEGYTGDEVLGVCIWMPKLNWALVAEMRCAEAFQPLAKIAFQILLVMGISVLVVLAVSILISRGLSQPIYRLAAASEAVARGDLDVKIDPASSDEIGSLTKQFNLMVVALRHSKEQLEASTKELLQAGKLAAVGRLVASIVHEMRNPLSAVKMNLRILQRRVDFDETMSEHLELAQNEALRLERMLNELLEYSKPVKPEITRVNLNRLLEDVGKEKGDIFKQKGVALKMEISTEPVYIDSDFDLVMRICDNIVSNAVEASGRGTVIRLKLTQDTKRVRLAVIDQGIGMSPKVIERLFEPFFTTRQDGIGLGMSNVKKFIEAIGASIEVDSAEGAGTAITLTFPIDSGGGRVKSRTLNPDE